MKSSGLAWCFSAFCCRDDTKADGVQPKKTRGRQMARYGIKIKMLELKKWFHCLQNNICDAHQHRNMEEKWRTKKRKQHAATKQSVHRITRKSKNRKPRCKVQVCSKANFKIRGWTEPNTVSFTMRGHHLPLHVCMQRSINTTLTKICVNSTGGVSPSFEPTVLKYPAEKPPVNAPWNLLYRPFSSLTV